MHHSESFIALKISHVHPCSSFSPSNKPLAVTDHLKFFNLTWGKMHIHLYLSTNFRYKVALSTFTLLCSQSPDFFSFSSCKTESLYSFKKRKKQHVPPFSQCLTTTILLSVSMNLTTLSNSCKWNSTISVFLWLAYFTKHNILMFIHTGAYVKMSFCIKTE